MLKLPDAEESLWREAYPKVIYPRLRKNLSVDVVVVGAGITGLTAAYLLKQANYTVAVLDKDTVGGGTTGRTTGKVTSQHNLIYADLQHRLGKRVSQIYGEANQAALRQVEAIIRKEKIDCDWQPEDNYVFTADPSQINTFKREAQIAADLGLPATFETQTPLPFEIRAAVKFSGQAKLNAQRYVMGLAELVNGDGSYVLEKSKVVSIKDGNPGRVKTRKAAVIAQHIIVATNVPTWPLMARGAYCLLEYPTESYIVAGRLDKPLHGMYISPDEPHYSILPVEVAGQRLVLIGGESHISGRRVSKANHYQRLADYAKRRFGVTELTHHWSDRDYLAYDGLPLIGKAYPWSKHLYVATAFRKWGLTNGTMAGMILSDVISGIKNPWAATFSPGFKATRHF